MLRTIRLYGALAKKFGDRFRLDVRSVGEAVRALEANFPGNFFNAIEHGRYAVILTAPQAGKAGGLSLSEQHLNMQLGRRDIHIVPVARGRGGGMGGGKGKAVISIVLGVALIAAAIIFAPAAGAGAASLFGANLGAAAFSVAGLSVSFGQIALLGVGLVLSGAASLLTPTPKIDTDSYVNREQPDERNSFLFNGPTNNVEQGGPVPLIYGRVRVGSVTISGSLSAEQIGNVDGILTVWNLDDALAARYRKLGTTVSHAGHRWRRNRDVFAIDGWEEYEVQEPSAENPFWADLDTSVPAVNTPTTQEQYDANGGFSDRSW